MDEPTPPSGKGDGPVEGWVRPEDGSRRNDADRRRLGIASSRSSQWLSSCLSTAAAVGFVYGFLGGDLNAPFVLPGEAAPGPIEFGTGGTECSLTEKATTFPSSAGFRVVATLNRPLRAGDALSMFSGRSIRDA